MKRAGKGGSISLRQGKGGGFEKGFAMRGDGGKQADKIVDQGKHLRSLAGAC
jgi:hypothetical protein